MPTYRPSYCARSLRLPLAWRLIRNAALLAMGALYVAVIVLMFEALP